MTFILASYFPQISKTYFFFTLERKANRAYKQNSKTPQIQIFLFFKNFLLKILHMFPFPRIDPLQPSLILGHRLSPPYCMCLWVMHICRHIFPIKLLRSISISKETDFGLDLGLGQVTQIYVHYYKPIPQTQIQEWVYDSI